MCKTRTLCHASPFLMLGVVLILMSGCQQPTQDQPPVLRPDASLPGQITLIQLCTRLGMTIGHNEPPSITLKDSSNTVSLFTYAEAQFYVNGQMCGPMGQIERREGILHVEESLVERIRGHLKPSLRTHRPTEPRRRARQWGTRGTILIDAGHGGQDPGAPSVLGFPEKQVNLSVARQVAAMLQQRGYRVVMTRDRDVYPSLEERWNLANRIGPDLFVSLHADSCATPSVTGFTVYIAEGASWTSKRAAQSIADSLASLGRNSRGVRPAKYKVLINTRCPAVLVEMGYLTNYWEARQLNDTGVQARIAQAIVAGIERTIR